ncbi:MAG: efflux RND transporter periplasmic adaptor subunit [Pirellula sp.]|nr:efflux RND transporter periplasmic adaptor subunit [Pirellula sp.]
MPKFLVGLVAILLVVSQIHAHEGHHPLPTRGIEVNVARGRLILTKAARKTLDVQTVEAESKELPQTLNAYGSIVMPWDRHAVIASPLTGRIVDLKVSPGETVSEGQVLAEMESPELEQLILELRAAQGDLLLSSQLVESVGQASRSGAIPAVRFIEAKLKQDQDKTSVELASVKWRSLQLPVAMLDAILQSPQQNHRQLLQLRSPIDGVVTHADLSLGKVVDPKEHLFEIIDLRSVWLKIQVLEKDLTTVSVGQTIEFQITTDSSISYRGVVDVVDSYLDPNTHLGTIWATIKNELNGPHILLPGMTGQVKVDSIKGNNHLVVPVSSVIRDGAERFVLVAQEQTAVASSYKKQPLVLGKRTGDFIEVQGGSLYPGDRVVTRGSHELGGFFAKGVLKVSPESARDIGLRTAPVSTHTINETIAIDGLVDVPPTNRSITSAQLGGAISKILVDRGQKVRKDQVLAEVTSQVFQSLQLDLLRANLNLSMKRTMVENLLAARESIAPRQLWENESQLNQFASRRDIVIQQLKTAGITDQQIAELLSSQRLMITLPVLAPMDGVIMGFDKFLGHVVRPDEPLFEIHDVSHAWVQGFISQRDFPHVRIGQNVRMRFVAAPDEIVVGTITRSGQSIAVGDQTLSVWIELQEKPSFTLQHNMLARIHIETGKVESSLSVPIKSIVHEGLQSYVFVEGADKTFERRFVVTGRSNDLQIGIVNGLSSGELIAVSGAAALQSGYAALK